MTNNDSIGERIRKQRKQKPPAAPVWLWVFLVVAGIAAGIFAVLNRQVELEIEQLDQKIRLQCETLLAVGGTVSNQRNRDTCLEYGIELEVRQQ